MATFCDRHWAEISLQVGAGRVNGVAMTQFTMDFLVRQGAFVERVRASERRLGVARGSVRALNATLDEIGPPCCFIGDDAVGKIMELCSVDRVGPDPILQRQRGAS